MLSVYTGANAINLNNNNLKINTNINSKSNVNTDTNTNSNVNINNNSNVPSLIPQSQTQQIATNANPLAPGSSSNNNATLVGSKVYIPVLKPFHY